MNTKQPQRSEQQEWTVERVLAFFDLTPPNWQQCKRVSDAINVELTAERGKRDQSNKTWAETNEKLSAMLAAERQRREQTWNSYQELRQQLLSALTAIEKHNKRFEGWSLEARIDCEFKKIDVDLSLLHKHDDEVRKPLVDALQKFLDNGVTAEAIDAAKDALAKVK